MLGKDGHFVTTRWVPSHVGLLGHDKGDKSGRDKARKGGNPLEQWSSLTHIKRKLKESQSQEIAKWHEVKTQERETGRRGFYVPWVKRRMNELLGRTVKKYASRYFQLKIGHGAVRTYLAKIGAVETPQCWWCGQAEQSVEHLHTKCRRRRREKTEACQKLV